MGRYNFVAGGRLSPNSTTPQILIGSRNMCFIMWGAAKGSNRECLFSNKIMKRKCSIQRLI